jgi:hypothetical protein
VCLTTDAHVRPPCPLIPTLRDHFAHLANFQPCRKVASSHKEI